MLTRAGLVRVMDVRWFEINLAQQMRDDAVSTVLNFITEDPKIDLNTNTFLAPNTTDCCYELPVFGEAGITASEADPLRNDYWSFLRRYDNDSVTMISMFLTKPSDPSFSEVALNNSTYGIFYPLGFHTDERDRNYIGYRLDWRLVLDAHGEGTYQIRADKTGILPDLPSDFDFKFCLANYTAQRADGTIRMTFVNSYILKDRFDTIRRIYFPNGWVNQLRVWGIIGGNNSEYEKTFTKYTDESLRTVEDREITNYRTRIDFAPELVHNLIKTEVLQADSVSITDYNQNNPWTHIETEVREPSDYKPRYSEHELLTEVEFEWKEKYDTGLKKHC